MSCDRFVQLRSCLYLVNNLERANGYNDKLYKVRPLIQAIRNRCLQLKVKQSVYFDEQIIPYKGKLTIKQYIEENPVLGVYNFLCCVERAI